MTYVVEKLEKQFDFQSEFSKTKIEGFPCLLTMQKEGKSVNSNLGSNAIGYQQTTSLGPDGQPSVEGQQEVYWKRQNPAATMSSPEETARYEKGINKDLDQRFEQLQKKRLWQGFSFIDALSTEEIDIFGKLWKKFKFKNRHLTFHDVSKLVEFATQIEECRRQQKTENTRLRVGRWRAKKVKTEESKVNETTRKVQASQKSKDKKSVRQRSKRKVKSGATGKSKRKRCVKKRKGK